MRAAFGDLLPKAGPLDWVRQVGDLTMIGLDTLIEGTGKGTLSAQSLAFLTDALAKAKNAPVLLALRLS